MKISGVITGDIVDSRGLTPADRSALYGDFKKFLARCEKEHYLQDFEMFRGDSFQCTVKNKEDVLATAIMIRAFIKSYATPEQKAAYHHSAGKGGVATKGYFPGRQDIRLAIGVGSVDFIKRQSFLQSDGQAFRISGEALDSMKSTPYRMTLTTMDASINEMLEPSILLLDSVIQRWTNNQAETVLLKLKGMGEEEIASKFKISRPAVNQRSRTSQWYAIEKLISFYKKTMQKI